MPRLLRSISLRLLPLLATACLLCAGCIKEDVAENTARGNFDALWRIVDEHYCFFAEKQSEYGLDWNEVYARYSAAVNDGLTDRQQFEIFGKMLAELRDGHTNLYAPFDVARYGKWFDDYPMNYSDSLERVYLGRTEDYRYTCGLKYRTLDDNIGYIRCESFNTAIGDGNLNEVMRELSLCDALILDLRNNGGGLLTTAQQLASIFINSTTTIAYMSHKTGTGHADFSAPEAVTLDPFPGLRWQKPVAVLTNRRTYSAANSFVMFVKHLPQVIVVGDKTGGGAGLPFSSELPNGWSLRFSACPMYDINMVCTESGIEPDVHVDITSEDYARNRDTIIETARKLLRERCQTTN